MSIGDNENYFNCSGAALFHCWPRMIIAITSIRAWAPICNPLLKTHPGNAIDNQSDKLVAGKVAFADLGSYFLTMALVF